MKGDPDPWGRSVPVLSQRTGFPHPCRRAQSPRLSSAGKRCRLIYHILKPSRPYQFRHYRAGTLELRDPTAWLQDRDGVFLVEGRRAWSLWHCELIPGWYCDAAQIATTRKHLAEFHLWCEVSRASVYKSMSLAHVGVGMRNTRPSIATPAIE